MSTDLGLKKIDKANGEVFNADDTSKIDSNMNEIQSAFNNLSTVASTGSYNDLIDKPTPTPSGSTVTISTINGNIRIDDVESKVYTAPAYTKSDVGLGNVDNTSDLNKPISTAMQTALNAKATVIALTSSEYSAISSPNPSTLYLIKI